MKNINTKFLFALLLIRVGFVVSVNVQIKALAFDEKVLYLKARSFSGFMDPPLLFLPVLSLPI